MKYKGFFVKITPDNYLPRENEDGEVVACEGFRIEVFVDESEKVEIDIFLLRSILNCSKTVLMKLSSSLRTTSTVRKKNIKECLTNLTEINFEIQRYKSNAEFSFSNS